MVPSGRVSVPGIFSTRSTPKIHLQAREALFVMRFFSRSREHLRIVGLGRVGIAADLVAELAAEHLVGGHVVDLAGDIPQRHFDAADAAALPGVSAELLDLAKDFVYVAGILSEDDALQHQRIVLARAVANFAETVDALVGIDPNDRARIGAPTTVATRMSVIFRSDGFRVGIDVLLIRLELLIRPESGCGGRAKRFEESAAVGGGRAADEFFTESFICRLFCRDSIAVGDITGYELRLPLRLPALAEPEFGA